MLHQNQVFWLICKASLIACYTKGHHRMWTLMAQFIFLKCNKIDKKYTSQKQIIFKKSYGGQWILRYMLSQNSFELDA